MLNRLREWREMRRYPIVTLEQARRESARDPRPMLYGPPMTKTAVPEDGGDRQIEDHP